MKILNCFSLLLAFFLTTCMSEARNSITGSGKVITDVRNLSGFDKIQNKSSINVILSKSNDFAVKVEADDNLIPYIITEVKDQVLSIRIDDVNIKGSKKMNVYISLPLVKELVVMGSGNIASEDKFSGKDIDVQVKGSGDVRFAFDGDKANIAIKGSGDLTFNGNVAHSEIGVYGSGDIKMVTNGSDADLTIRGSGNIAISGSTKAVKTLVQGSGNVEAEKFSTQSAMVTIQGSGNCTLNVAESLDATIKGSGDVFYSGNASNVSCKNLGSGKVKRL